MQRGKSIFLVLTLVLLGLPSLAQNIKVQTNLLQDLQKGRRLNRLLQDRKADSLYARMGPALQQGVKGKAGFSQMMEQLPQTLGKELRLLEEASFVEAGHTTYYRISAYEQAPSITTKYVWKDTVLLGLTVSPTPAPAPSSHQQYKTKTNLGLPFKGTWYVAWGGNEPHLNKHITAEDQRYAFDFLYAPKGELVKTQQLTVNEDYHAFGQEVFAPGEGVVVAMVDSVSDNVLGKVNTATPPGNHVVIDHQNGEYSFLAHFKQNSIKVKIGQKLKRGDFVGLVGNSGRSEVPHLHYHLQTEAGYRKGEGLPLQFKSYQENGKKATGTSPKRGQYVSNPI